MSLREIADRLVAANQNGTVDELLSRDYADDVVSVEAAAMDPSRGREVSGIDGLKAKHAWWMENTEVHSTTTEGPFLHGEDRFAVIYEIDCTDKASNRRMQMREVAVYHVANGKIVREEFFYTF